MKTSYLLIDFENVQPRSLAVLRGHTFRVKLFVGANQTKVSLDLARELQALGEDAEYIQISGSGRNALDFHIAYMLGELVVQHADANFYVVSKDTGFDPLIRYLSGRGVSAVRIKEVADIPVLQGASNKSLEQKVEVIVTNLRSRGSGRPRKVRTLKNTINALFGKKLTDAEVAELVRDLDRHGHISIEKENVSYHL